ncbi:hypothetical protein QTP86_029062, partial [Hemibagrus guttatus]
MVQGLILILGYCLFYKLIVPIAFSAKSKDSSVTAMKGQGKGRDRKKNPCLRKRYINYCVHGVCQYLADLNRTSCTCDAGYSGDRCHLFILPVGRDAEGNSHTTALAVMAVVLSLLCLTIIGILLALRLVLFLSACTSSAAYVTVVSYNN